MPPQLNHHSLEARPGRIILDQDQDQDPDRDQEIETR